MNPSPTSPSPSASWFMGARVPFREAEVSVAPAAFRAARRPLDPPAGLDASGSIRIGALKLRGVDASDVSATIRSGGGRIDVAPLRAAVFRGTLDASAALTEAGRHRLRMDLTGVDAGLALEQGSPDWIEERAQAIGAVGVGERGRHQGDRDGNDRHHPICSASTAKKSEWRSQGTLNRSRDGHSWMVLRRRRPHCADR